MFKKLKLGLKIGAGFAAVVLIIIAMASLAIRSQESISGKFTKYRQLADENTLAHNIEAAMLNTAVSVVHYSYSRNEQALKDAEASRAAMERLIEGGKRRLPTRSGPRLLVGLASNSAVSRRTLKNSSK